MKPAGDGWMTRDEVPSGPCTCCGGAGPRFIPAPVWIDSEHGFDRICCDCREINSNFMFSFLCASRYRSLYANAR